MSESPTMNGEPARTQHRGVHHVSGVLEPIVGLSYEDAEGRELWVLEVEKGERSGREVRGWLKKPGSDEKHPYTTTLIIWQQVWRDKAPRWSGRN